MANPKLIKEMTAEAAVLPFRIVKIGATDGSVLQSTAVSETLVGVADELGQATVGGRVGVILDGIADVTYGATVTRGARLTTDASGRAVTAAPGAGTNNGIIGTALVSGVVGDVGTVHISPSIMQG